MKRLHLLIDGLAVDHLAEFPHLARLIARARPEAAPPDASPSAALARMFGVEPRDLAAIRVAAEGIEPGSGPWFCADPVHLLAGMRSLSLLDGRHFSLSADESRQLVEALNSHFADEIEFHAPHPQRWYARFKQTPAVAIPPLDQVAGTTITPDLIAGPDARALQRAAMEIQMVLHAHPVNDARESRGEASVNGLWFWGGGAYRKPSLRFEQVLADDHTAAALARAADTPHAPLAGHVFRADCADELVVVMPDPAAVMRADTDWFKPILAALMRGQIAEATLTAPGPQGFRFAIDKWRSRAIWRRR